MQVFCICLIAAQKYFQTRIYSQCEHFLSAVRRCGNLCLPTRVRDHCGQLVDHVLSAELLSSDSGLSMSSVFTSFVSEPHALCSSRFPKRCFGGMHLRPCMWPVHRKRQTEHKSVLRNREDRTIKVHFVR
jgi:hypothetical protein